MSSQQPEDSSALSSSPGEDSSNRASNDRELDIVKGDDVYFLFEETLGPDRLDEGDFVLNQMNFWTRKEGWGNAMARIGFGMVSKHITPQTEAAIKGGYWNTPSASGRFPDRDFPPGFRARHYENGWTPSANPPDGLNQREKNDYNHGVAAYHNPRGPSGRFLTPDQEDYVRRTAVRECKDLINLSDLRAHNNEDPVDPNQYGFKTPKEHNKDLKSRQDARRRSQQQVLQTIRDRLAQPAGMKPGLRKRRREEEGDDDEEAPRGEAVRVPSQQPITIS